MSSFAYPRQRADPSAMPSAKVARLAGGGGAAAPADAAEEWSRLVGARDSAALCAAWLDILCGWLPGVHAGVVLVHDGAERYAPAAAWPDPERDLSFFSDIAQQALAQRHGVVGPAVGGLVCCAYPLAGPTDMLGVVVLQMNALGDAALRDALRVLHWGAGWIASLPDKRELADRGRRLAHAALVDDVLLGVPEQARPDDAARWVVNRLAQGLGCRVVMLARSSPRPAAPLRLAMVSGTAGFDSSSTMLALAREALGEAAVAGRLLHAGADRPGDSAPALDDYRREAGAHAVLALPLSCQGRRQGALLLDFGAPPSPGIEDLVEAIAAGLAPLLELHESARRSWWAHSRTAANSALRAVLGPRRPALKLASAVALVAVALAALVDVDYRVHSPASIEGLQQRAAVAPFEGYVVEAPARPGDTVRAGDVLARLDDRELRLELARGQAGADVAERKLRETLARNDAAAVRVAEAELDEARATLDLARHRLARATIVAPLDGLVVHGDWSQQLGAPVEQGKLLFELAPTAQWRVVLKVDERDIVPLRDGQRGEVVVAGLPGETFPLRLTRVSPVAQSEDGRTSFRVEAELLGPGSRIRPGMEGVARVLAGRHSLLWIASHRLVDEARSWAWSLGL
jgi:RND family efflux transporter MFP subunit